MERQTRRHTRGARRAALLSVVALSAVVPELAHAQEASASQSPQGDGAVADAGSIIVTARRRAESIVATPVAVSVTTGEALRKNDVKTAPDLIRVTPGLTAQLGAQTSRRTPRLAIRGQGGGTGVVSYFAEVPEFGIPFYGAPLFDLDNVQVLKGPVGTLFGRVTTGGAVLYSPKLPADKFGGYLDMKLGKFGRRDFEGAINVPLVEDLLAVRVSGQTLKSDGFSRNLYDNALQDGSDGQSFRAIVDFTPSTFLHNTTIGTIDYVQDPTRAGIITLARQFNATLNLGAAGTINRGNTQKIAPAVAALNGIACPAGNCPTWLSLMQNAVAQQAGRSVYSVNENNVGYPSVNLLHKGVINTTTLDLGPNVTLKNIFSYQQTNARGRSVQNVDATGLPLLELADIARPGARSLTEEIQGQARLFGDRLQVQAGFFYEKNWTPYYQASTTLLYGGYLGQGSSAAACTAAGARADAVNGEFYCYVGGNTTLSKSRSFDKALYGQATLNVTDKLSLTAGYRYTWSTRRNTQTNFTSLSASLNNGTLPTETLQINGAAPFIVPGVIKTLPGETFRSLSFEQGTYNLAAQYQFSPDLMVYATTRRGYNPGNFNSINAPAGHEKYGAEIVTDYEVGIKANWRAGDVRGFFSFDAYRDNFSNAQRNVTQPVNGRPVGYIDNVAKIRIQGFDFDASASIGWFTLAGFVTLTDAKYLKYPNTGQFADFQPPFDLTTFHPANVSKWLWSIRPTVELGRMAGSNEDISLSGNIYHRGDFSSSEPNVGVESERQIKGFTTVDLRLDWRHIHGSGFSAGLAVNNVTDFNGKVGGNELRGTNGENVVVVHPPRSWYVEFKYDF